MNLTRRNFIGGLGMTGGCPCGKTRGRIAVQLYSVRDYYQRVGIAKTLEDVAGIGYTGVEICDFSGQYRKAHGLPLKEFKARTDALGLAVCGSHVGRESVDPANIGTTCECHCEIGCRTIIVPGGGNNPDGTVRWFGRDGKRQTLTAEQEDFAKRLCDFYNRAAADAAKYGCRVGIHNHTWEFAYLFRDGTTFWDYFFAHTDPAVCMEQDVGWTTCAGHDPCAQYAKYPHRSPTLHAKENGYHSEKFDAILGKPGILKDGTQVPGVNWDGLVVAAEADGVAWWVVETEAHPDSLFAIAPSYAFLKGKGLR